MNRLPENQPMTYASTGVNYDAMDPLKKFAQQQAFQTSKNIERFGFQVVELSRGESAFIIDEGDRYSAHVIEGLGTKNLVADNFRQSMVTAEDVTKATGRTYYKEVAQDTVAMIVNDLITVGADPVLINAYWAAGDSEWFKDLKRSEDLVIGWREACDKAGAVYGGGEIPTLKDIIFPPTVDLAGSSYGIIRPKDRLTLGDKLTAGDAIVLIESSGIHANGLTLARAIAAKLPQGYKTRFSDGIMYGEALLKPTHIYAKLVQDFFDVGIDIHYMVNITGHGWRKLMRANRNLSYIIERVPRPQPVFQFIQEQSGNDDMEMYGNFNMGAGFVVCMSEESVALARQIAQENHGLHSENAGHIEEGLRQVIIRPKHITYRAETLGVR